MQETEFMPDITHSKFLWRVGKLQEQPAVRVQPGADRLP